MRYLLPLALVTAAALGATHQNLRETNPLGEKTFLAPADPPWLRSDWPAADSLHAGVHDAEDPHAGLHGIDDPHAGLYASDEAHAAYGATGAHAAVQGMNGEGSGVCPRDGAEAVESLDAAPEMAPVDPHAAPLGRAALLEAGLEPRSVARSTAANGHSIADLHARRSALAEQTIRVRGTVVKRNDGIFGRSYVHLWDGSATAETHADDLTVTTSEELQIGETVEVEGRLLVDQDLGLGYRYAALLDGATRVVTH
jgi:hypothetical protein